MMEDPDVEKGNFVNLLEDMRDTDESHDFVVLVILLPTLPSFLKAGLIKYKDKSVVQCAPVSRFEGLKNLGLKGGFKDA